MREFTLLEDGELTKSYIDKYVFGESVYQDHFEWQIDLNTDVRGELGDIGSSVYFKMAMVTPDDERKWFRTHLQWSASNRYAELEAGIYS